MFGHRLFSQCSCIGTERMFAFVHRQYVKAESSARYTSIVGLESASTLTCSPIPGGHEEFLDSFQGIFVQVEVDLLLPSPVSLESRSSRLRAFPGNPCGPSPSNMSTRIFRAISSPGQLAVRESLQNLHSRVAWTDQDGLAHLDDREVAKTAGDLRHLDLNHAAWSSILTASFRVCGSK